MRADGPQNLRVTDDVIDAQHRDGGKPDHGDRPEKLTYATGAAFLHRKQTQQNHQCERDDRLFETRRHHFQAFDRRQH